MTGESDTASLAAQLLCEQQGAPLPSAEAQMVLQQVLTTPQAGWHGAWGTRLTDQQFKRQCFLAFSMLHSP